MMLQGKLRLHPSEASQLLAKPWLNSNAKRNILEEVRIGAGSVQHDYNITVLCISCCCASAEHDAQQCISERYSMQYHTVINKALVIKDYSKVPCVLLKADVLHRKSRLLASACACQCNAVVVNVSHASPCLYLFRVTSNPKGFKP